MLTKEFNFRSFFQTIKFLRDFKQSPGEAVRNVLHTDEADYDAVSFDIGIKKVHIISNPDLIDEATRKPEVFQKPKGFQKNLSFYGQSGVFTSTYDDWSQQKAVLARFLTRGVLPDYQRDILDVVNSFVNKWEREGTKDLYEDFKDFAITNFFKAVFKFDISPYKDDLKDHIDYINQQIPRQALNPLTYIFGRSTYARRANEAFDYIWQVLKKIHQPHMESYQEGHIASELLRANEFYNAKDEVEKFTAKQKTFEQAVQLFVAGYDSTASSLTWLFHRLAHNPDVQDRVCKEISEKVTDGMIDLETSRKLEYLQRVIFETVRINPTLHLAVPRKATKDFTFKSGYQIKKGEYFIVPILAVNTDPARYDQPYAFDPDRETALQKTGRVKEGDMAFYAGPHACIGKSLFLFEASILVVKTLEKLKLVPAGRMPNRVFKTTIVPENGHGITFEKRTSFKFDHVSGAPTIMESGTSGVAKCPFHRMLGIKS